MITAIGWILVNITQQKAATQIETDFINSAEVEPKFSAFINKSAADAINPTITGRNP